mmetsp:Transcript_26575/g.37411  ORF Transcript_26575/g.37411 Transcript_26575/m.37411 type:complete len:168 (+) Transcript_26575:43-546(+)
MSFSKPARTFKFEHNAKEFYVRAFPIVHLPEVFAVVISLYGVRRKEGKIYLQEDYTEYIMRGKDGIKQPDGRFVFPFLVIKWIPLEERKHDEFCFVYNLYKEDDTFLGHRRCDSTLMLEMESETPKENEEKVQVPIDGELVKSKRPCGEETKHMEEKKSKLQEEAAG